MQSILKLRAPLSRHIVRTAAPQRRQITALSHSSGLRFIQKPQYAPSTRRWNTSLTAPESHPAGNAYVRKDPSYNLTFTCKPCGHRSNHNITKHGYHKGTILIKCPECEVRHLISDHLKIFMDEGSTLEDILRQKLEEGQTLSKLLKKGKLGMRQGEMVAREGEESLEFWEDGSETTHDHVESEAKAPQTV